MKWTFYDGIINSSLVKMNEREVDGNISIESLVERAHELIDSIEAVKSQRNSLEKKISDLTDKIALSEENRQSAENSLSELKNNWAAEVKVLGLEKDATASEAQVLLDSIQDLFSKLDGAEDKRRRIEGMDKIIDAFEAETESLCGLVASDLIGSPANQKAAELSRRLQKAQQDKARWEELENNSKEKEEDLRSAQNTIDKMTEKLSAMCRQARCSAPDEMAEAERRSEEKRSMQERLKQLENDIEQIAHGGGMKMDELIQEAEKCDPDSLPVQLEMIQKEIEEKKIKRDKHLATITTHNNELEKMDGNSKAAEAEEEAQSLLAQMGEQMENYLCLRMSSALLGQEIERYCEENQNPILRRASELFGQLTLRSFSGLKSSYDEKENQILVGVRPNGDEIPVEGMSEGTSDQLYLSLRLASLEKYLEKNEPMPFILDDILVQFDDERACATLKVLADLSKKTQIIFFTHHSHLLNLAKKVVSPDVLQEHSLKYLGTPSGISLPGHGTAGRGR